MTGLVSYHAGLAAEESVARRYERAGCTIAKIRWRGKGGEIDLIVREGAVVVFVEVKKAASHAQAAARILPKQMARIAVSAAEFLNGEPAGELTDCRFDVALVDAQGQIEILPNAFSA